MLLKYTEKIVADVYINAAKELNLGVEILDIDSGCFVVYNHSDKVYFYNFAPSLNNLASGRIAENKFLTHKLLCKSGIPVPKHMQFSIDDLSKIYRYADDNFPLVIKPNNWTGGIGVITNIRNIDELNYAIQEIRNLNFKKLLAEEHIVGRDYRILIFRGEIIDVLERIPAFVMGDGASNITALIDKKNEEREFSRMPITQIDERLKNFLERKDITLETVPKKGEKVILRNDCNFWGGGESKRMDINEIHKDNINLFIKSQKLLNLDLCGIDFITPDIRKSHMDTKCAINEINSAPGISMHYFADQKEDNIAAIKIFKLYFNRNIRRVDNFEINDVKNSVAVVVKSNIYSLDAVKAAANSFSEDIDVIIEGNKEDYCVKLSPLKNNYELEDLGRKFNNELLKYSASKILLDLDKQQ